MHKVIKLLLISIFVFLPFSAGSADTPKQKQEVYVYISMSKSAKCYHASRKCQSLRKSRKVVRVKLSYVQNKRMACKHCYTRTKNTPTTDRDYLEEPER